MSGPTGLQSLLSSSELELKDTRAVLEACADSATRPLAVTVLAKFMLPRPAHELVRHLKNCLDSWLDGTDAPELSLGFAAFTSVFQIEHATASELLKEETLSSRVSSAMDATMPVSDAHRAKLEDVTRAVAVFLATASSFSTVHPTLSHIKALDWASKVEKAESEATDIRCACLVVVAKLSKAILPPAAIDLLRSRALSRGPAQPLALEALGIASLRPEVKRLLAADAAFMKTFCSYASKLSLTDLESGLNLNGDISLSMAAVITQLVAYPPVLTEEQQAHQKLRNLAHGAKGVVSDGAGAEDPSEVEKRNKVLLNAGAAPALVWLLKSSSEAVKSTAALGLLSLAETPARRGPLLQAGAPRALLSRSSVSSGGKLDLNATQALAKLLITAHPGIALGSEGLLFDALAVLARMLIHEDASPLQHFEGMMALTNISSLSAELATRCAALPRLLEAVDTYMLESHPPLRCRAATELACNLAGSPEAKRRWNNARSATLFLALARSGQDDERLALAAAGGLARLGRVLADAVLADQTLTERTFELIDTGVDDGLALRGLVFLGELIIAEPSRARARGFADAIGRIECDRTRSQQVRETAHEALEALKAKT